MTSINRCGISDATEFHSLWALPGLPLTEKFGPYNSDSRNGFDQELLISIPTGHVQLRNQLDPKTLYSESEYSFRTGASGKSRSGVDFFLRYLAGLTDGRRFASMVDIGGNDLFVAQRLGHLCEHRAVIDPICQSADGQVVDGVKVFGRFIEAVDLGVDLPQPDLVICRHTLEHIAEPRALVSQLIRQCRSDCLYVIEVPCFENLTEALRFDAVFHQHLHYYDLGSVRHLIWECGGEYLHHTYNHQGSCGGALLVAFRRAQSPQTQPRIDLVARISHIQARIAHYRDQMRVMGELMDSLPGPAYGYGASLMLATLGYHLKSDFASLECILDDDPTRDGVKYENVPISVRHTLKADPAPNSSFVITSLENVRPIFKRITELAPRRILVPLIS